MEPLFSFQIEHEDTSTSARAATFTTAHGKIKTPVFMPVGTKATVKGLSPCDLNEIGAQIILANTYHLEMRPGSSLIAQMGGLQTWERWDKPILTDSGGFQVFSLEEHMRIEDDKVRFRAVDYDGAWIEWTPQKNMEIAQNLGSDICMQLDICCGYPAPYEKVKRSMELSATWAEQCYAAHTRPDQALFGIVQGGMDLDLRRESIRRLQEVGDFFGYGIGGYSVGEPHETMFETLTPLLGQYMPKDKPRYLMGVGNPATLVRAVGKGVDMFDCVLPTRTARMGSAFTSEGRIKLKHARFALDKTVLDPACGCPVCKAGFSRSYLHHLVKSKEMLGAILLSKHNLYYLLSLMRRAREAIIQDRYEAFQKSFLSSREGRFDF